MTPEQLRATESAIDAANRAQEYRDTVQMGIATNATTLSNLQVLIVQQNAIAAGLTEQYALLDDTQAAVAADRVQTGLDRVATGADRVATAADRVQTGLDRVATGADKAATAADRTQVGTDRTAAQTARTGAETAQTGAQTARTGAETAQTGAQTARTGAEAARDLALGYRDAASGYATTASTQAGNAATSAADALSFLQSFRGLYYGAATADPVTDPNGAVPGTGDIYYNTTNHIPRVYDSVGGWKDLTATVSMGRWNKLTTVATTTISGTGDVGGALAYTPGLELIFIDGSFVEKPNYTATNGTSITFNSSVPIGKTIAVLELSPFNVANAMTIAQADSKYRPIISYQQKTSNILVVASDNARRFSFNGTANATLILPPSSSVFSGFGFEIKNNTNFKLTITPASGDTIDGATSLDILPKQECAVGLTAGTTWETFGLQKQVRLSRLVIGSAQATVPIVLPFGYDRYILKATQFTYTGANSNIGMRVSFDGGTSFKFDGLYYRGNTAEVGAAARVETASAETQAYVAVLINPSVATPANFELKFAPGSTTVDAMWSSHFWNWTNGSNMATGIYSGVYANAAATGVTSAGVNAISIFGVDVVGNFTAGVFTLYGEN